LRPGLTIRQVLEQALAAAHVNESEREGRLRELTGRAGFADLNAEAASLSGGWRKRLAITEAMVIEPEVMLLDEPTNHLDLAGIEWLEELLRRPRSPPLPSATTAISSNPLPARSSS
jgi:ATP-binding cassette subfamily F protein uup